MQPKEVWRNILTLLEKDLTKGEISTFLGSAELKEIRDGQAHILFPNRFAMEKARTRSAQLTEAFRAVCGGEHRLSLEVRPASTTVPQEPGTLFHHAPPSGLGASYRFENFVVGLSNQLAASVAGALAEQPGKLHNPFFLYSGVGLGKTHLLQAIGNAVKEREPEAKVIYASAERFTTEFIRSIQSQATAASFRRKFRSADVLLIDDIQFLASREASQEEFFNTFNELYLAGKQVVIASDRHPTEIRDVQQRLVSRFGGGMITDIQEPDLDLRLQILRRKAAAQQTEVAEDVLLALAQQLEGSIRQLEGTLHQLLAVARSQRVSPSAEVLRTVLRTAPAPSAFVTPAVIIGAVCQAYQLSPADIRSTSRSQEIARPRQVAAYLLRQISRSSLNQIGGLLGGRDHSTILYGLEKIERQLTIDGVLKNQLESIRGEILGKTR